MGSASTKQVSQDLLDHKASTQLFQGTVERGFKDMRNVIIAVIVVLVVAFVSLIITVQGLVITYQHDSQDVYTQSRDATNTQNDKIDELIKTLKAQQQSSTEQPK